MQIVLPRSPLLLFEILLLPLLLFALRLFVLLLLEILLLVLLLLYDNFPVDHSFVQFHSQVIQTRFKFPD